jgi:anti-sigma B factor antagonist
MSARAISLVRRDGDACVVALAGEHDLSSVDELTDALHEATSAPGMVVDLSGATFIDSAVLGALIASHREAASDGRGWALVVSNGSGAVVRRILQLTGLDEVMPVYPNLGEALAANLSPESGLPQ